MIAITIVTNDGEVDNDLTTLNLSLILEEMIEDGRYTQSFDIPLGSATISITGDGGEFDTLTRVTAVARGEIVSDVTTAR